MVRGADKLYSVSITCGEEGMRDHILTFLFNERFLPVERSLTVRFPDGRLMPNHKYLFSEYKAYDTDSGEKVWFPDVVVYVGYNGRREDGEPLETCREEYHIKKMIFNSDIPDSMFELDIPREARVNDLLTGLGWLPPGERPAALFPAEARARRLWAALAVTAVTVLVGAVVLYRRWKRHPGTRAA
jgi:hypothetical protein